MLKKTKTPVYITIKMCKKYYDLQKKREKCCVNLICKRALVQT